MNDQDKNEEKELAHAIQVSPADAATSGNTNQLQKTAPKSRRHRLLWIVLGVAILALMSAAGYIYYSRSTSHTEPVQEKATDSSSTTSPELAKFIKPTTGEQWLTTPQDLPDQGFYREDQGIKFWYYEVGTRGENEIILSQAQQIGYNLTLFERSPQGVVRAILYPNGNLKPADEQRIVAFRADFASNIQIDTTTHYDSLSPPTTLDIGSGQTVMTETQALAASDLGQPMSKTAGTDQEPTTIHTFGQTKLVRIEHQYVDTGLTSVLYSLYLPIGSHLDLTYRPIPVDLSTYTWNNGVSVPKPTGSSRSSEGYMQGIVRGCGSSYMTVSRADAATDDDFVIAGKSANGLTVYAFKDNDNPIVQKAYSEYVDFYTGSSVAVVPLHTFLEQHAIIAYKSSDDSWLIYTRNDYAANGGCAKPVIYLYPDRPEAVRVNIGANVRVSDPLYNPKTGWQVFARPNGQLTVNGNTYQSLFWEGTGVGPYPAITNGTVVKRADVVATMRTQLAAQGLNMQETNDFIAYWSDKIPDAPYVRLAWFNTAQINELAPLYIAPTPKTLIRVFLDMAGLPEPMILPEPTFHAPTRQGFTVVEWGGLARQKL